MEIKGACPFCGSTDLILDHVGNYWVECNQCEASGPKAEDEDDALRLWASQRSFAEHQAEILENILLITSEDPPSTLRETLASEAQRLRNTYE